MEEITATYTQLFQNYPDVVSTLQLCEMLGVSERTVYRLLVTNQIKHFKAGRAYRIPKVNVFAFMESECGALVVSLSTPSTGIDLYTPIITQVQNVVLTDISTP